MTDWMVWWLLVGVVLVLELFTGTFFLLMLALGLVAGALAAHAGLDLTGQLLSAAVVGAGAVAWWQRRRAKHPVQAPSERNPDINLDIGQVIGIQSWEPGGMAHARYRGADWAVQLQEGCAASSNGRYRIVQVQGSTLIVQPLAAAEPAAATAAPPPRAEPGNPPRA